MKNKFIPQAGMRLVGTLAFIGIIHLNPALGQSTGKKTTPLFNGKDLKGWDLVVSGQKINADDKKYVTVHDGMIHMYEHTPATDSVGFGYLITKDSTYSNFYLTLEYRWLDKKFIPRKNALKDAGVLYHVNGKKVVWPSSVECQIQEGDTGDLIFLTSGGLTYAAPAGHKAPEGQGTPYVLPELSGSPKLVKGGYYGRMPEYDRLEGWNTVELIVHGKDYAEHIVNGKVKARTGQFFLNNGQALAQGGIALQLEGAEIQYRNVNIQRLEAPLKTSQSRLTFSKVQQVKGATQKFTLTNPGKTAKALGIEMTGKHADAFKIVSKLPKQLKPQETIEVEVAFNPSGSEREQSAGLKIGDRKEGAFLTLSAVLLEKFEGENETPLQSISNALGMGVDVGGRQLKLGTSEARIGESILVDSFKPIAGKQVKVTPIARFSPKGNPPFGILLGDKSVELGRLADVSAQYPDAHQRIFPPLESAKPYLEFEAGQPFQFYYEGHNYRSSTQSTPSSGAPIKFTGRVFPVKVFQGKPVENTYLIGFEEAQNGDYQDAVFLVENVGL